MPPANKLRLCAASALFLITGTTKGIFFKFFTSKDVPKIEPFIQELDSCENESWDKIFKKYRKDLGDQQFHDFLYKARDSNGNNIFHCCISLANDNKKFEKYKDVMWRLAVYSTSKELITQKNIEGKTPSNLAKNPKLQEKISYLTLFIEKSGNSPNIHRKEI